MNPTLQSTRSAGALILGGLMALANQGCVASREIQPRAESPRFEAWPGARVGPLTLPAPPVLSSDMRRLTFLFFAPAGRRTAHAISLLRETLMLAGYRLVLDPKAVHDARIDVHFEQTGDSDAVEMAVEREGRQIESMVGPLAASEAGMQATLEELVTRMTLSPRLALLTQVGDPLGAAVERSGSRESNSRSGAAHLSELAIGR